MMHIRSSALALALATAPLAIGTAAFGGQLSLPQEAPLPVPRPDVSATATAVVAGLASIPAQLPAKMKHAELRDALEALRKGDTGATLAVRDSLDPVSLNARILTWAVAMSGEWSVSANELEDAAEVLAGWPGMQRLKRNLERARLREADGPAEVIRAIGNNEPLTTDGRLALARAHLALGNGEAAREAIAPYWRTAKLDAKEEASIIEQFGPLLTRADHRHRMERMLLTDRVRSAMRVAEIADAKPLADAWAAAIRKEPNALALLDAVPTSLRSPGYYYAKARYLRRKGNYLGAAEAILAAPTAPDGYADPRQWWQERRVLSRELLDIEEYELAYKVAAAQRVGDASTIADAAFHAGWYALRFLNSPHEAALHFQKIAAVADGPISNARAFYWLGRAAEAAGNGEDNAHYETAARYDTAFYGQLAAAKLGRDSINAKPPATTIPDRKVFFTREPVRALRRLEEVGQTWRADIIYRDLAEELESVEELTLLAELAETRGDHYLALRIGKSAASRGLDIGALAHPTGAIPADASVSGAGKALAYAIGRQESEFRTGVVSHAGARGILQLLPGTAREMARIAGVAYSTSRLTDDAAYNASLGAAYLSQQLERFDGSYILTFVGYNAGPSRSLQWIERFGDPRGKPVEEVVDWMERIPFTETRNYVQRVFENYQVYKMRLTGEFEVEKDLVEGRRD
ncbi:lytic transglycosylase domain-containing protein [Nitratireductor basaltis]|uniref:Lytic transglycosylase, catalytic n=1 Tax=Nitratireductor basaltis TaxID=472175 RepID=A0A084UCB0_9HYPH|nr:lytic transglycosylase domain-containing protein [Nitratireductor basaltis]KFB10596.1 Lytic transglycosylase, catalytic precursor [Nitratireductor basaltis]